MKFLNSCVICPHDFSVLDDFKIITVGSDNCVLWILFAGLQNTNCMGFRCISYYKQESCIGYCFILTVVVRIKSCI